MMSPKFQKKIDPPLHFCQALCYETIAWLSNYLPGPAEKGREQYLFYLKTCCALKDQLSIEFQRENILCIYLDMFYFKELRVHSIRRKPS